VFIMPNIVRLWDQPRFLRYLIASRQIDTVLLDGSEMGCLLLPYLRAHFRRLAVRDAAGNGDARAAARRYAHTFRPLLGEPAGAAPSIGLGRACAAQAVEIVRLARSLDKAANSDII
jgi:hypothetical protein